MADIRMKSTLECEDFQDRGAAAIRSRFEQPEIGPLREPLVRAQLGGGLQKLFPPESESSTPEQVRCLLQKMQEIFAAPSGSKPE
jgi:hypothetical protein